MPNRLDTLTTCPSPEAIRCGRKRLGAVDDAPVVDVHHALDVLELADFDVAGEGDTRVVVDLVDLAEVLLDRVGVQQERLALGDVEPVGLDLGADGLRGVPP